MNSAKVAQRGPSIFSLLKPYSKSIGWLVFFSVASSALGLAFPKIISHAIDSYIHHTFVYKTLLLEFIVVALAIYIFTYLQNILQTYTSERVARDLREEVASKISMQSYAFIEKITPAKLLTNLTSDIDAIKTFVAQAIATLVSSVIIVVGASILLLTINWKLALAVLLIVPLVGILFFIVFRKVKNLMALSREALDWLNRVINESILGSALVRVLNSHQYEYEKFFDANTSAKNISLRILKMFASMIPAVTFIANLAVLIILVLGGKFVIGGTMSLGDFAAFNSYLALLIFPIIMIGIMSNAIAQATASYERVAQVLVAPVKKETGTITSSIRGEIEVRDVSLSYGEKPSLKHISFIAPAKSKTAIIGPTAAGKTQLLYQLIGLTEPSEGVVMYDGQPLDNYNKQALHQQIGFVFQDSIIFNLTLRENIAFSEVVTDTDLNRALETAEIKDLVDTLPQGLDTIVSERGTTLSGGQKQRIMLARALALNPKVLLLDDFTARVDTQTEEKILGNIEKNYPDITLISVTQKIGAVQKYDQIVLLMEGEVIARGTHEELLESCTEYVQIYNSQKSTSHYE